MSVKYCSSTNYNKVIMVGDCYFLLLFKEYYNDSFNRSTCLKLEYNGDIKFNCHTGVLSKLLYLESSEIHTFINLTDIYIPNRDNKRFIILNRTNLIIDYQYMISKRMEQKYDVDQLYLPIEFKSGKITLETFRKKFISLQQFCFSVFG